MTGHFKYRCPEVNREKIPYRNDLSDIYSIGDILYRLVVGKHPFNKDIKNFKGNLESFWNGNEN